MPRLQPLCKCGCGEIVTPGKQYIQFHGRRGSVHTKETKAEMKITALRLGHRPPQHSREQLSMWAKARKGKYKRSAESKERTRQALLNSVAHKAFAERLKVERKGEGNPAWKGGTSMLPYPYTWTFGFKEQIRDRQGRFCHVCWKREDELHNRPKRLDVHHVDENKQNSNSDNFLVLCHPCHQKITMAKWQMEGM